MFFSFKFCFLAGLFLCTCCQARSGVKAQPLHVAADTVNYTVLGQPKKGELIIKDTIELDNKRCVLPEGITLSFNGGLIKNGTLVGSKTKLKSSGACFDRVRILGTWDVPVIKSSLFRDLSYDNALKDVMALSDSSVKNKIIIEEGEYQVTAYKNGDICVPITSSTTFILNGTIKLTPNDYRNYYIIHVEGNNITIEGKGAVIGDKHFHTGDSGEWGMGISFQNAHHVTLKGLTVKDCWGDCIYVGGESSDINIEDCLLDHGRRQGISITSANGVVIKNSIITNVGGTAPQYAIDIEPNKGNTVDNIVIQSVVAKDCVGGFLVYGKAEGARVGHVSINKSIVMNNTVLAISIMKCDVFRMEKCKIIQKPVQRVMHFEDIGDVRVWNNSYHNEGRTSQVFEGRKRVFTEGNRYTPITISGCGKTSFSNNIEK